MTRYLKVTASLLSGGIGSCILVDFFVIKEATQVKNSSNVAGDILNSRKKYSGLLSINSFTRMWYSPFACCSLYIFLIQNLFLYFKRCLLFLKSNKVSILRLKNHHMLKAAIFCLLGLLLCRLFAIAYWPLPMKIANIYRTNCLRKKNCVAQKICHVENGLNWRNRERINDALFEIEGMKLFPCSQHEKVKVKGRPYWTHMETQNTTQLHLIKIPSQNLFITKVADMVETIKSKIIKEKLFGTEIHELAKNLSCAKDLYNVYPIVEKFWRKCNSDQLFGSFFL